MENASEALIMIFGFFALILALSISISLISEVRETSDIILSKMDKMPNEENEFIYTTGTQINREVNLETIIPSMYRAYKERYKIVFLTPSGPNFIPYNLYQKKDGTDVNTIDLDFEGGEVWATAYQKDRDEFIKYLLSGKNDINICDLSNYTLYNDKLLYNALKDKNITEYLGEYFTDILEDQGEISNKNRIKKRIITYVIN